MAAQELIVQSLKAAAASCDNAKLADAYAAIQASLSSQSTHRAGLESLVICSETAVQVKNLDIAKRCLETYFLEIRRYTSAVPKVEVRDQYLVRAHYALGKLVSSLSHGLKGKPLVDGTLEAIQHVLHGLQLAASNPGRYLFLVYNGSVHHWHVSRPLQCPGLRHHLLPSMEKVWQALEKVPGHEEWKVRNLMALAMCQAESAGGGAAGKGGIGSEEATKTLQRAYDMAAAHNLICVQKEVAVLQVHLACRGGDVSKAGLAAGKAAPPPGAKPGGKAAGTGKGAGALPNAGDEEAALRAVQAVLTAKPADRNLAEQMLKDAVAKVDPKPVGSAKGIQLMPVAQAAWAAAVLGLKDAAENWASRAAMSQELAPRVWSDMTRVLLKLQDVGPEHLANLEESALEIHMAAMDSLDDVVTAFMKIKDVQGCHEAARLTWNAGLVLLQPSLRRNVKRAFNSAAKALEVIDSPLHRLRVALHLEAAKCDAAEDALIKASQEVSKAQALDYVVSTDEQGMFQLERPLDRYLEPLAVALALRTSLTQEPEGAEEEAVALVERSKESRNPSIKKDLLGRAIDKLSTLPLINPPAKDYKGSDRPTLQVACRRRTVVWGDLIRSAWGGGPAGRGAGHAAAMKLEESVLAAAPYCLHTHWDADVDKEMVMLQAEVSFMEAEAALAALKKKGADVVPPPSPMAPTLVDDGTALRLPNNSTEHLQDLVLQAIVRGMQWGLDIKEPWLVINGAVLAWNTYLPVMHQHRYVDLQRMLEPVVNMLLQLKTADTDGGLVCGLAEAYAKALEHKLLLTMLTSPSEDIPVEEIVFRHKRTPGYELLPAARVKTTDLKPQAVPAAVAILNNEFPKAIATCEAALSKAGNAQSQALFESYARLQQLRGQVVSIPAGTSATSEQTSKVVGIIEAVLRGSGGEVELRQAMSILQGLPHVNVELWAKLARAAANAKVWPVALECAKLPGNAVTTGFERDTIESPSEVPELDLNSWFWLAVLETVRGQAIMSLVRPGAQDMMCCLNLRRTALESYVVAARFAGFVKKTDLVEHVARLAWDAALPFMRKPLLRVALVRPLAAIAAVVNRLGVTDRHFQMFLNVVLLESMASGRMWGDAITAADEALKSIPSRSLHRPILTWKSYCLAMSGRNVLTEMTRVKEYIPEYQGHAWAVLSHHSVARYDQVAALNKAQLAVANQPWNKAEYLMEWAEWLITSGHNEEEIAEDVLLTAADALLEYDVGDDDGNEEEGDEAGKKKTEDERKKKRKRLGKALGEASLDPHSTPTRLTAPLLDRMMRIWIMLSQVANTADEHTDYMLTAHHYAVRMLTSAIIWAYKPPKSASSQAASNTAAAAAAAASTAAAGATAGEAGTDKPAAAGALYPPLPDTLAGWAEYPFTEEVLAKMKADNSVHALAPASLPEAEVTLAYLDLLIRDMKRRGCDMHVLPLFQLQRLVAKLATRNEGMYHACTLKLCSTLDELGLSAVASKLEVSLGSYWEVSKEEDDEAAQQRSLQAVIKTTTQRFTHGQNVNAGASRAMSMGRSSMMSASSFGVNRRRRANSARDEYLSAKDSSVGSPMAVAWLTRSTIGTAADRGQQQNPSWLLEAAADMAAGGVTTTGPNASFGVCNGVGGGSGTACSMPIDMSTGGLLSHVRSLLLLRPLSLHDVWLRKAEHLIRRGHYTAARELLRRAHTHADACDNPEALANILLMEAKSEASVCNYTGAIKLVQQAQAMGGDYDFWRETICTYVDCRLAAPHTTTTDAREALEGGIAMFAVIANVDIAAEKDANLAAASLKLRLSQLLLTDMVTMRKNGVFNWKKHYEQAVKLCGNTISALAAREGGIPHIQALLHQAILQMEDPKPEQDMRPRYKKIQNILVEAEERASKFMAESCPRDLDPFVSFPVGRLLARVRLALAELHLMQSRARDDHAANDRQKKRPKYPVVPTGSQESESIVVEFIDAMEPPEVSKTLSPEDTALALAISAAQLCNANLWRAKALLLAGQCLQYKFLASIPEKLKPWPSRTVRERRRTVIGMGDLTALYAGRETSAGTQQAVSKHAGRAGDGGSCSTSPSRQGNSGSNVIGLDSTSAPFHEDGQGINGFESDDDFNQDQVAAAETYRGQALTTLQEALTLALGQCQWHVAEQCALEAAKCYGKRSQGSCTAAAQFLCLAQACKAVAGARELLLMAQPAQSAEALLLRQMQTMAEELPRPEQNVHFQRVQASLAALGTPSRLYTSIGPTACADIAANLHDATAHLPEGLRVITLYVSPDRSKLYIAALNVPDTAAAEALAAQTAQTTPTATKKDKDVPAPPPATPKMVLLNAVRLEHEMLDSLRNDLRAFRRNTEKVIRESISAAVDAGWGREDSALRGKARTKTGGKRASSASTPHTAVFPAEVNEQWTSLMWRFDLFLSPFVSLLHRALDDHASGSPAGHPPSARPANVNAGKGDDTTVKQRVALLLDPELASLPWEALPLLKAHASSVTRHTSLYALRAGIQAVAEAGGMLDLTRMSYMVDTRHEGSAPEHTKGPCWVPLIPWFKSNVLTGLPFTKEWKGLLGAPGGVPPHADTLALLESASSFVWLGLGRFLTCVPPAVVSSLDLRGCDAAILLGRVNNDFAHQKQVYIDNRKSASERALEAPSKTAELLLARGVKTVVVCSMATTASNNTTLMQGILSCLASGLTVAEAVWKSAAGLDCELEYQRSTVLVMGAPNLAASATSSAKTASKTTAGGKKK